MAEDLIRYDILAQDALRGVVRKVLAEVARTGLPGEHHFYITFDTRAPGVRISSRLMGEYPQEMTVILQHQFWDLSVTETGFEVGLSFNGVPERLLVPFNAIKAFIDPSVQFTLQFETATPVAGAEPAKSAVPENPPAAADSLPAPAPAEPQTDASAEQADEAAPVAGADVVSLDTFRKKR